MIKPSRQRSVCAAFGPGADVQPAWVGCAEAAATPSVVQMMAKQMNLANVFL
jgi:hypothetical protein